MKVAEKRIPLTEVAVRLGLSWHRAYNLALKGTFGRPEQVGNRWLLPEKGVQEYEQAMKSRTASG